MWTGRGCRYTTTNLVLTARAKRNLGVHAARLLYPDSWIYQCDDDNLISESLGAMFAAAVNEAQSPPDIVVFRHCYTAHPDGERPYIDWGEIEVGRIDQAQYAVHACCHPEVEYQPFYGNDGQYIVDLQNAGASIVYTEAGFVWYNALNPTL